MILDIPESFVDLVEGFFLETLERKREAFKVVKNVHPNGFTERDFGIPQLESLLKQFEG